MTMKATAHPAAAAAINTITFNFSLNEQKYQSYPECATKKNFLRPDAFQLSATNS